MADLLDIVKDETSLIWLSSGGERNLKLDSITKFIPGQNTPVFQHNLHPEDCLSFPLIYKDGKLSLDLSCKDIVEAEVWFAGLKTLVSLEHCGRSKVDGWSEGLLHLELKDMAERLPLGVDDSDDMTAVQMPNGSLLKNDAINVRDMALPTTVHTTRVNVISAQNLSPRDLREANGMSAELQNRGITHPNGRVDLGTRENSTIGEMTTPSTRIEELDSKEHVPLKNGENGFKSKIPTSASNQVEAEWIEQYEPGVYITLMALRDGTRDLKRVRFSRRRFGEHQAETWWSENREKVYEKYNVRISDRMSQAP